MFRNPVTDVVVVLVVVLLIFGPKRLPQLGKSLGQGMREFKDGITGNSSDSDDEERQALPAGEGQGSKAAAPERDPAEVAPSDRS